MSIVLKTHETPDVNIELCNAIIVPKRQPRCRVCREIGHTILKCESAIVSETFAKLEEFKQNFIRNFPYPYLSRIHIQSSVTHIIVNLSNIELAILAVKYKLSSTLPCSNISYKLINIIVTEINNGRIQFNNTTRIENITRTENTNRIQHFREFILFNDVQIFDDVQLVIPKQWRVTIYLQPNNWIYWIYNNICLYRTKKITGNCQNVCPICFTAMPNVRTKCNHYYCDECILQVLNKQSPAYLPSCPLCREKMDSLILNDAKIWEICKKNDYCECIISSFWDEHIKTYFNLKLQILNPQIIKKCNIFIRYLFLLWTIYKIARGFLYFMFYFF